MESDRSTTWPDAAFARGWWKQPRVADDVAQVLDLPAADHLFLMRLAHEGAAGPVTVSEHVFATWCRLKERSIRSMLARLEEAGLIEIRSSSPGARPHNAYTAAGYLAVADAVAAGRDPEPTVAALREYGQAARAARLGHVVAPA